MSLITALLEPFKDIDNDNGGNNQFLYDSLISSLDLMPALLKTAAQNITTFTQWYTDSKADPANIFTYMDDALVQCENSINSLNSILTSSINDSVGKSGELFKTSYLRLTCICFRQPFCHKYYY